MMAFLGVATLRVVKGRRLQFLASWALNSRGQQG